MTKNGLYTDQLALKICSRLAAGMSLRKVCRAKDTPSRETVLQWVANKPDFRALYVDSLLAGGLGAGDEVEACNDEHDAVIADLRAKLIEPKAAMAMIMAIRAKQDALKWIAARKNPKVWGNKLALVGADGGAIKHRHRYDLSKLSDAQFDALEGILGGPADPGGDGAGEETTQH